jgi:hypothetical protein
MGRKIKKSFENIKILFTSLIAQGKSLLKL